MNSKKKVAIVRGPGLSKWEMQIYEPLGKWFDLIGIGSTKPVNDISGITFPIKKLICPTQYMSGLPKMIPVMFNLWGDTQWLWGFDEAVKGSDIVHCVELHNGFTVQAVRAKKKGLVERVTLRVYETIPYLFDEYSARKRLKQEVIAGADHFLAANEMAKECLVLEGVNERKISIVPQSVDTRRFDLSKKLKVKSQKLRRDFKIAENDQVVLSVGRMVWEKGWDDVIAAAAYVRQKGYREIKFLCVGTGPELERYRAKVRRENLEGVVNFVGGFAYRQMPELFSLADVFVYATLPTPSWNAQFGGVLIEAMAGGLPVVGSLAGGTRDSTVGVEGGIFVQPQHFSGLAKGILEILRNKKLYDKLSRRNRKFAVDHYDVEVVARQIKRVWDSVLNLS